MNADVRQVLLARAEASHSYAVHLLAVAVLAEIDEVKA